MINIERFYANRILQESMDRITDIFGKRKDLLKNLFLRMFVRCSLYKVLSEIFLGQF